MLTIAISLLLLVNNGDVAQLGEHLNGIQEARGSIPLISRYQHIFILTVKISKSQEKTGLIICE
jgi:hypothetical protein